MLLQSRLPADGIFLSDFPHLERWMDKLSKRPGFDKGRHVMNRANV